ncbi:MAG TPA: tRNA-specific adenosine deaminase, partial [Microbacterium sp.]|nr:tRNA-specific adenosine deaminase [Microbacterium sp.]
MTHADTDRSAMGRALELAREAGHTGEVPVGAV